MTAVELDNDFDPPAAAAPSVFAGRFLDTATTSQDELTVRLAWFDSTRTGVPVTWAPNGSAMPTEGDPAWVMEAVSENGDGNEWIVVMWRPAS